MRQHLPPKLSASRLISAAYLFASALESSESHALVPSSVVGCPAVRSATAIRCCRSSNDLRSAS
eukprot:3835003-Pleurochrysis_carterae.AAC.1